MIKIARDDHHDDYDDAYDDAYDDVGEDAIIEDGQYQSVNMVDEDDTDEYGADEYGADTAPISNFANQQATSSMTKSHKNFFSMQFTKSLLIWFFGCFIMLWMFWGSGFYTMTKYGGLSLRDIQIYNLDKTDHDALLAQADLRLGESIFRVDLHKTKMAIDELPWVEQSHIVRVLPGSVHIYITEHRPVAIWQQNGQKTLVSHDGSPIGAVENFTDYEHLPVITGESAPTSFYLLQSVLESYPELQHALRGAKMSRAARWTIYLENGTLVHLPVHNIDEAFIRLRWLDQQFQVLSFQSSVIDLRVRDRAAIGNRTIPVATQNIADDTIQASS
ncbi:MAG: cell division protein FtsQ/DivIB [Alphaproteobacteria bacterium]|nr:cell division protein FtsQ/DivIB [Alphaproteobacteria bacterium]